MILSTFCQHFYPCPSLGLQTFRRDHSEHPVFFDDRSEQWRSQEFLSIGQFPSQTILRTGQSWAIEKSTGLQYIETSYLFSSQCLLKRKVNNPQPTEEHIRYLCTTSQRYFSTLKCPIIFCVRTLTITIFSLTSTGEYPTSKPSRCRKLFPIDVKGFPGPFLSSQIF